MSQNPVSPALIRTLMGIARELTNSDAEDGAVETAEAVDSRRTCSAVSKVVWG